MYIPILHFRLGYSLSHISYHASLICIVSAWCRSSFIRQMLSPWKLIKMSPKGLWHKTQGPPQCLCIREAPHYWIPVLTSFRLLVRRRPLLPLPTSRPVRVWSRLTVPQSPWFNQKSWDSRFTSHWFWPAWTSSKTLTSESRSPVVVTFPRFTPSDKPLLRVWLLTTKSTLTRLPRTKSRRPSLLTTRLCWLPTPEEWNQRSSVVVVPEPDSKSLTVKSGGCCYVEDLISFISSLHLLFYLMYK